MEIGIYANTHGQGYRDDTDMFICVVGRVERELCPSLVLQLL